MRCARLLSLCLFFAAATLYADSKNPADYPLRIHIFNRNETTFMHMHSVDEAKGEGRANLFANGDVHGVDFTFDCDQKLKPSFGFETYSARWKKPNQELTVLMPVFGKTGAASPKQACQGSVQASTQATPPSQTHQGPPLTMVATSPDGKYLAGYAPDGNSLTVWASGQAKPATTTTTSPSGVTAIGWDRRDYLWVAEGNATTVVAPATGDSKPALIENSFPGKILGLGIAPDGVRVAAIVQGGSGTEVELAAIGSGTTPPGQLSAPFDRMSIGQTVQLGPNVPHPVALTWYDADDLLVLDGAGAQTSLWEVPVDGQPATRLPGVLPSAISITANKTQKILVAGLTGNRLEVSAGLAGPWQLLGGAGQNPAFQTPAFPAAAQP